MMLLLLRRRRRRREKRARPFMRLKAAAAIQARSSSVSVGKWSEEEMGARQGKAAGLWAHEKSFPLPSHAIKEKEEGREGGGKLAEKDTRRRDLKKGEKERH